MFSLVVPTYNEALNIIPFLSSVHNVLESRPHEVLVVDDDSPDKTYEVAGDFSRENSWVRVLRREKERGLSQAVLHGFHHSRGMILGVMDADLSHDEKILPTLLEKIENGCDLAVGSRRIPGGGADKWPWIRRLTSHVATGLAKGVLRVPLSDPMSGYFVLKKDLFLSCQNKLNPKGYKILLELACKGNPRHVEEVPFIFKDRTQGVSKLTGRVMIQYLQMVFSLWVYQLKNR